MAISCPPDRRRPARLLAGLALAALCAARTMPAAEPDPRTLPINVDAASSDVDYRSNTVVFRDVVITQGGARVAAANARATGLDFVDSTWEFTGRVRIDRDGGTLESDRAKVRFRDNVLESATIEGKPARFEQQLVRTPGKAHGRAETIVYDMAANRVTFTGDAWLTDGRNEISGQELVYNVADQRVLAETQPGDTDRVRITIRPQKDATPADEPAP
ncbi:MAG TPA: lipopolysaccharide transport periplasmic protein LptA [Steroidobacteraceae bacterium]|nr:lipopolysaccharide transport periplasmic protein LptA [Steroidobacteraceae bacterium]HNS26870.1 lipopolysaccharide transport periplasmic protein LptA [Steroidobacteraceae bacterium]